MNTADTTTCTRIIVKNVLFLSDFSRPSEAALPYAAAVAREFGATIHALHVLTPQAYAYTAPETTAAAIEAQEENANAEMQYLDARLTGFPHDLSIVRDVGVWPAVEKALAACHADLIVLGTHGRTGAQKLLLGSVAEEIFRRSPVPVMTIGPWAHQGVHNAAQFRRVLLATDFTPDSMPAASYAVSIAQEHEARLILLHAVRRVGPDNKQRVGEFVVADAMQQLHELIPESAGLWCRPEAVVEYGQPSEAILQVARVRDADLIVIGVRDAAGRLGAAVHLENTVAHKVVAHAPCPVLTVRA